VSIGQSQALFFLNQSRKIKFAEESFFLVQNAAFGYVLATIRSMQSGVKSLLDDK